jgi:hypothetical protein
MMKVRTLHLLKMIHRTLIPRSPAGVHGMVAMLVTGKMLRQFNDETRVL